MPKYNVTVSFSLRTMIEPDGIRFDRDIPEGVEDIEDASYFRSNEVDADGGSLMLTVECESEERAEEISEEIIFDSMEVEDDSGFTWIVDDRSVEVEEVEIPMDLTRAKTLIEEYIDSMDGMDDDLREAFGFMLRFVADLKVTNETLDADRRRLDAEVRRLDTVVARQAGEIDRLTNGPDGSEAVTV